MLWLDLDKAVAAWKAIKKLGDPTVVSLAKDLLRLWWKGGLKIFLVGCGGTGKTSLRRFLESTSSGVENLPSEHVPTQVRVSGRGKKLERFCDLFDYPGQDEKFWEELNRDASKLHSARRAIVIMCCSYGFHSDWGLSGFFGRRAPTLKDDTVSQRNFEKAFADCRENELKFLETFLSKAQVIRTELTMVTVILKLDLWFNENQKVDDFYSGAYHEVIEDAKKWFHRGLRHEFRPLSLRQENFIASLGSSKEEFQIVPGFSSTHDEAYKGLFLSILRELAQRTLE